MHTQTNTFATLTEGQQIAKIGVSVIEQPKPQFQGGGIKWFDESRLLRKRA